MVVNPCPLARGGCSEPRPLASLPVPQVSRAPEFLTGTLLETLTTDDEDVRANAEALTAKKPPPAKSAVV